MAEDMSVDAEIRESAKRMFDMAMSQMVDHYRANDIEKGHEVFKVLSKAYAASVDSNGRLLNKIKELEGA